MWDIAARFAIIGCIVTGILGVVLAINAVLSNNETGAGVLLLASAAAFGLLAISLRRE
jgi:hypothetical protein